MRRRRKLAAGLAVSVATGAFGVFLVTRPPVVAHDPGPAPSVMPGRPEQTGDPAAVASDADLKALVDLADVDRSSRISAKWSHIQKPVAPYKKLLKGVTP